MQPVHNRPGLGRRSAQARGTPSSRKCWHALTGCPLPCTRRRGETGEMERSGQWPLPAEPRLERLSCRVPVPPVVCPVCTTAGEMESQSFLAPNGTGWNPRGVRLHCDDYVLPFISWAVYIKHKHPQRIWMSCDGVRVLLVFRGVWETLRPCSDESDAFMLAYSPVSPTPEKPTIHLSKSDFTLEFYFFDFNITVLIAAK